MIRNKTLNQKPVKLDNEFVNWLKSLKFAKSEKDNKDYSFPDISAMLIKMPELEEIKKKLIGRDTFITGEIRIQMDRRRRNE